VTNANTSSTGNANAASMSNANRPAGNTNRR
jgi:hypothetical protein